ncbi:MAG TPA: hypothetical protein VF329_11140 [Gammaproteobacteria bacterium]
MKHALRQLALRPGLSAALILMLALGIGGTTAIFSLFHQILVRPLPVPEPDRLVNVVESGQEPGTLWCGELGCNREYALSYPMFRELEARQDVFTGLAAHHGPFEANFAFGDRARARAACSPRRRSRSRWCCWHWPGSLPRASRTSRVRISDSTRIR